LGTGQYSQKLDNIVIGGYFCCCHTQYNTDQRRDKVQAIRWSAHMIDGRKGGRYSAVYISLQINTLLSIGIGTGYWYR